MARGIVAVFAVLCSIIALPTLVQLFRFRVTAAGALFELAFAAAAAAGCANHQIDSGLRVRAAAKWGSSSAPSDSWVASSGLLSLLRNPNQGPMLGIFITGPLGFVVGAIFGLLRPAR